MPACTWMTDRELKEKIDAIKDADVREWLGIVRGFDKDIYVIERETIVNKLFLKPKASYMYEAVVRTIITEVQMINFPSSRFAATDCDGGGMNFIVPKQTIMAYLIGVVHAYDTIKMKRKKKNG